MALYYNVDELGDIENLDGKVLSAIISVHEQKAIRLNKLKEYYLGKNVPKLSETDGVCEVVLNYPRYIVEQLQGFYLGDPIRYTSEKTEENITGGVMAKLVNGEAVRANKALKNNAADIGPILEQYKKQTISEVDARLGQHLGIFGEAYEIVYSTKSEVPEPRSAVIDARCCEMIRDDTIEHNPLFFISYEKLKRLDGSHYYSVTVYTDRSITSYKSNNISSNMSFTQCEKKDHFFKEVPIIEYENNIDRLGDFEPVISAIDAYNVLMSNRITDKNKFIDSVLALFGASLGQGTYFDENGNEVDMIKQLKEKRFIEFHDKDARLEYIQKQFDENSISVLAKDIVREIHKQSMVIDMTDEKFGGNSSGQALKLKLTTMTMQAKNKMRQFEKGLKKRFRLYNNFLNMQGLMDKYDSNSIELFFTLSIPTNELETVKIVKELQGIVDDETLLSLLWFVKDPGKMLEKVKKQEEEREKKREKEREKTFKEWEGDEEKEKEEKREEKEEEEKEEE